jgi:hypothetical protein
MRAFLSTLTTARTRLGYPGALCALWSAMVLVVNPIGDFPLNDDWAYGLAVRDLVDRHSLLIPPWTSASLVAQLLYGFLFCLPFGFSFTALRIAALTAGLGAVLAAYALAREAGVDRGTSFICAATLAANPLFFECSNTFMTDVPFLAFSLVAVLLAVRALRSDSRVEAALSLAAALAAVLTRQVGLLIPLAVAGGLVLAGKVTVRRAAAVLMGGLTVFATLRLYEQWLRRSGQVAPLYGMQARDLMDAIRGLGHGKAPWAEIRDRLDILLIFSGWLLAPVLLMTLPFRRRPAGWIIGISASLAAWFTATASRNLLSRGWHLPFRVGFNLIDVGVGPLTLTDVYFLGMEHFPRAPAAFWWGVTWVGIAGGALLVYQMVVLVLELMFERRGVHATRPSPPLASLVGLVFVTGYGVVMLLIGFYDRYLIPIFPLLAAATIAGPTIRPEGARRRPWMIGSALALCATGAFSIAATHDYLSWNRARWTGLNELIGPMKVSPDRIDGGFEFNGRFRYGKDIGPKKSWWWVHDDEFLVTFGEVPGYETLRTYGYPRMIPPLRGTIFVLRRGP